MKRNITILVPSYNEAGNLAAAVTAITTVMRGYPSLYEILLIDDGSTDETYAVASQLAHTNGNVRVLRHEYNKGFGDAIRTGIREARYEWVATFHGDNDASAASLRLMADTVGKADFISGYLVGGEKRPLERRVVSALFVRGMNLLFGLHLRYYTGFFVARRDMLLSLPLRAKGLMLYAEIRVNLLSRGVSIVEVPLVHTGRKHGTSSALNMRALGDIVRVLPSLATTVWQRKRYKPFP